MIIQIEINYNIMNKQKSDSLNYKLVIKVKEYRV